jgi:AcrR family transcriptional regulator
MVQARAEATRTAVVQGAAVVFNREGFAGAKTTDIVREAGVSKGAMQFHFHSKESLAHAVVDRFRRDFDAVDPHRKHESGIVAAIELSAVVSRQLVEEPIVGAAYRLTMEESPFAPRVTKPYLETFAAVERLLNQAVSDGELRRDVSPGDLARYVVASFIGVQAISNTLTSRTDLIQRIADMWLYLLPSVTEPERVNELLRVTRSVFVSQYTKSRMDLAVKGIS